MAILGPKKANFMILGNFHGFLQNFQKKWKLEVPLAQKLKVVWKNLSRLKSFKILWILERTRFHAKKIIFGHFKVQNVLLKKSIFFEFFSKNFQAQPKIRFTSAWKIFFSNFPKVETISGYLLFLSSKNLYNWLLKLNFGGVAFGAKRHKIVQIRSKETLPLKEILLFFSYKLQILPDLQVT